MTTQLKSYNLMFLLLLFCFCRIFSERANNHKKNGIDCMGNVREMKFITSFWVIADSLANMKEKALLMPVFIRIESKYCEEVMTSKVY